MVELIDDLIVEKRMSRFLRGFVGGMALCLLAILILVKILR
jgi:hypothetical protein